ncbi:hypothetical protein J11TS1_36540 [Oceanobacillus sp. J11TS1]|nr:hypothetical protein J11TS1_36540 [Oceanobacillus sp. J11TS1]
MHANKDLLRQKIYQIIAGYAEDDAADALISDPVFTQMIGKDALASQPSLSRFLNRFDSRSIDGVTADFLKSELRPGNVYTSNSVVDFVRPLITHYNEKFPWITPFLRADSGFAVVSDLYDLCEKESVSYVIRLKSNAKLQRLADELHPASAAKDMSESECYFEESEYQAKSWKKARKIIIKSVRPAGEIFFTHSFFVTNLGDVFSP